MWVSISRNILSLHEKTYRIQRELIPVRCTKKRFTMIEAKFWETIGFTYVPR